ncbi:MAG: hypothetical protein ACOCP4_02280 [Candidatus Woesearchaeota archaeon]
MKLKKFGIFTPYSVNLYAETNSDNPANFLKRNAILFENLVIVPQGIGPLDGSELFTKESYLNAYSKERIKQKEELKKILLTIEDFVNKEDDLRHFYMPQNPETSMWLGQNSSSYIDFIKKYVQIKNGYDKPEIQSRDHKKELEYYIGAISMDFQILAEVTRRFENFSGLYSEIHEQAFTATYGQKEVKTNSKKVITAVETINYFDFGSLTWDEIIELRKSQFANDFRKKVWEWTNEFNSGVDNVEVENKIYRFIDDAKFDFIEERKPNQLKTSLTGILGNIPLPIPVNPISIASAIDQSVIDNKAKKEFGWLLFIQKARKNCTQKTI